jgi:endonuclease/exonuclease/phosphatase family metal-dependent hydrolase
VSRRHAAVALALGALSCQRIDRRPEPEASNVPIVVGSTTSSGSGGGHVPQNETPPVRLATWNLHNFSKWGTTEYRIDDIATEIERLEADVIGVQELKPTSDTSGEPPQAWDVLLDELDGYDGVHNPWSTFDTTVGLVYRTSTTTLLDSRALFEDDSWAFPRAPLEATVQIAGTVELTLIVLHLKAFQDSVDRRRAACDKLDDYLAASPDTRVVLLGDLNDDPHDPAADNAFVGTFLDAEPTYHFVTHALPPESVTSLGYHHAVDGMQIEGEFLDHFIVTGAVMDAFTTATATIASVPAPERDAYESSHSDHFPVVLDLALP